jgi:polyhydroxyalkanoate synthase subunit PhaC
MPTWASRSPAGHTDGFGLGPSGILDYDGPETIRVRKYVTGTHVLLDEIGVETGVSPKEVVWAENKARLYRYRRADGASGTRRAVPLLLIYGFVLKPYVLCLGSFRTRLMGGRFESELWLRVVL